MFRRGRRSVAIALTVAALALPAAPALAAGFGEAGTPTALGEVWEQLGRIGDWLRATFLSDYTSQIDPNGAQSADGTSFIDPDGLQSADHTSHIDPDGLQSPDHTGFIDPNG